MATSLNRPVDHRFRSGLISNKEWKRLSMKQPGKGAKTHGRMADFDSKTKDDGQARRKVSVATTGRAHIDGPDQGDSARGAFSRPTKGGYVQGGGGRRSGGDDAELHAGEIDQRSRQKPDFPRQGSGRKPQRAFTGQGPGLSHPSSTKGDRNYGDPPRRPKAPSRLRRVKTNGSAF